MTVKKSAYVAGAGAPVDPDPPGRKKRRLKQGMALCLSGGGYRAMVFHLGSLVRLNEAGLLRQSKLKRVSSVSGGSLTAAVLGMNWTRLQFDRQGRVSNFKEMIIDPVRELASTTVDWTNITTGLITPKKTISDKIIRSYDKILFHGKTLADLPADAEGPRFVLNATNVQSGALWRFSKPYMADYKVGRILDPDLSLAEAAAASSAFPPVLSPARLKLDPASFVADPHCPLQHPPYTTDIVLTDGGVYDNLGLETAWKNYRTILVSDAGGKMRSERRPKKDWALHSLRVLDLVDNQVRSLRKRQLIESYKDSRDPHEGAYWGIRTDIRNYELNNALPCPLDKTTALADIPTRLKRMKKNQQQRLINWGYAVCDAALRKHYDPGLPLPEGFPYPCGVG